MTFKCVVGGTDIAANGVMDLTSLRLEPAGDNVYGTAEFIATAIGGSGFAPIDHQEAEIYDVDGSNTVTRRYFGGFIASIETEGSTNVKRWKISCRDYNELLDAIGLEDVIKGTTAGTSFPAQVAEMVQKVQNWSAAPTVGIDASSGVADLTTGYTGYPHRSWSWTTLRKVLTDLCAGAQAHTATLRPRFYIGLDATNGLAGNFGVPTLYIYDGAATPGVTLRFSDRNSDILAGTHKRIIKTYKRKLDGTRLLDRQGVLGANGLYSVKEDTTAKTRYPNPYSSTNSWSGAPISDTSLVAQADVDARATVEVAAHAFSRETTEIATDQWVRPGSYVSVTNTLEGLSNVVYPVVAVKADFSNPSRTYFTLSLGARVLELGETDNGGGALPVEKDVVPPATPTGLTVAGNSYVRARNQSDVTYTWTANSDADLYRYWLWLTVGGVSQAPIATTQTSYTASMAPSTAFNAYLTAEDTSGNKSSPSATVGGTSATVAPEVPGPPATVTVTGTRTGPNTGQANLSWTAGTGGTGTAATYEARYYVTASGASTATIIPVANDNRVLIIPGLAVGTQYTFNVRSITVYGDEGGWSTSAPTLTLAAQAPPAPTGLTVLDYDPGQTGQSAWILLGWTAGTGGTGTVATYNVRVDWTEASTGVVRKWHRDGIPATDVSTILSPLTAGPSYTITMWAITNWGDSSSAATLTYSLVPKITPVLYNPDFEIPSLADKTLPDGWTVSGTGTNNLSWGVATDQFYSGTQSFKSTAKASGTATLVLTSRRFAVLDGSNYYLAYAIRRNAGTTASQAAVVLNFYNNTGTQVVTAFAGLTTSGGLNSWTVGKLVGAAAAPATAVVAEMVITLTSEASTSVWIDGIDFRIAPSAVDVTPGLIDAPSKFGSGMAAIQQATSNPGSPATNDTVFRTDLDRIGTYDGTRWLSVAPVPLPWMPNSTLNPFSASGIDTWYAIPPNDLALYLERWTALVKVNTTNNASNYWTVALQGFTVAGGVTTLDSFTTAALAANTNAMQHRALSVALTAGQYDFFALIATKTNTPGTLVLLPHLRAREILS